MLSWGEVGRVWTAAIRNHEGEHHIAGEKRESSGTHITHGEKQHCEMLPTATAVAQITHEWTLQPGLLCSRAVIAELTGRLRQKESGNELGYLSYLGPTQKS